MKPYSVTPDGLRARMRAESAVWAAVVKAANIRSE